MSKGNDGRDLDLDQSVSTSSELFLNFRFLGRLFGWFSP